jgi:predicted permease
VELGFESDRVLVVNVNAQRAQLEPGERAALFGRVRDAAAAVPGVATAAVSAVTPVSGNTWNNRIELPDGPSLPENERLTYINLISGDWFRTYGTPFLAGRDFTPGDTLAAQPVAIVNETFARKFNYGRNPVGMRLREPGNATTPAVERQVVGYVRDAVYRSLRDPVPPTMYLPYAQQLEPPSSMSVSVRAAGGSPGGLTKGLAAALKPVHGDLALTFQPLTDHVNAALTQERVVAWLSGFFGALALLLSGVGLYGVTSFAVSRRRTEIGIRMALGAAPGSVLRLVMQRVAILVATGIVLGTAVCLWASRFVATLLFGLEARDPLTLAAAAVVLSAVGAMAGWLPARRASRLEPARVLAES